MKNICFLALFAVLMCAACTKSDVLGKTNTSGEKLKTAMLRMKSTVMATSTEKPVPTPIHVYVFDTNNSCVAMQTLKGEGEAYQIELVLGSYDVYALAGAEASKYNLPTQETASLTSEITLKDVEANHAALEAGRSANKVNITEDNEANCNIELKNLFAQLNVKLTQMPTSTSSITVKLSNLTSKILLNGTLTGTDGEATVSCAYDEGTKTWSAQPTLIFPGMENSKAKITVKITDKASKETTINVTGSKCPKSNAPYNLTLRYEKGTISGNISSSDWDEPIEEEIGISPDEGDENEEDNDDPKTPSDSETLDLTTMPTEGSIWNDCLVLSVDNMNENKTSADLVLMSTQEWENVARTNAAVAAIADTFSVKGLSGWDVIIQDKSLIKLSNLLIHKKLETVSSTLEAAGKVGLFDRHNYIMKENRQTTISTEKACKIYGNSCIVAPNDHPSAYLRLIKEYHLTISQGE